MSSSSNCKVSKLDVLTACDNAIKLVKIKRRKAWFDGIEYLMTRRFFKVKTKKAAAKKLIYEADGWERWRSGYYETKDRAQNLRKMAHICVCDEMSLSKSDAIFVSNYV